MQMFDGKSVGKWPLERLRKRLILRWISKEDRLFGLEVAGTVSRSCLMAGFDISYVEPLNCITMVLVSQSVS